MCTSSEKGYGQKEDVHRAVFLLFIVEHRTALSVTRGDKPYYSLKGVVLLYPESGACVPLDGLRLDAAASIAAGSKTWISQMTPTNCKIYSQPWVKMDGGTALRIATKQTA